MMNKVLYRSINIPNYFISHELIETSKLCDYDYDDTNPRRRFYMSLLHRLSIIDPIINSVIIEVEFMSEVANSILDTLYSILNSNVEYCIEPVVIQDKSIRVNNQLRQDAVIAISYLQNEEIKIDIICNNTITTISLYKSFLEEFIYVMNIEEDFSEYEMYSGNDGW